MAQTLEQLLDNLELLVPEGKKRYYYIEDCPGLSSTKANDALSKCNPQRQRVCVVRGRPFPETCDVDEWNGNLSGPGETLYIDQRDGHGAPIYLKEVPVGCPIQRYGVLWVEAPPPWPSGSGYGLAFILVPVLLYLLAFLRVALR